MIDSRFNDIQYSAEAGEGRTFVQSADQTPEAFLGEVGGLVFGSRALTLIVHGDSRTLSATFDGVDKIGPGPGHDVDIVSERRFPGIVYRPAASASLHIPGSKGLHAPWRANIENPNRDRIDHLVIPPGGNICGILPGTILVDGKGRVTATPGLPPEVMKDPMNFEQSGGRLIFEVLRTVWNDHLPLLTVSPDVISYLINYIVTLTKGGFSLPHEIAARFHRDGLLERIRNTGFERDHEDLMKLRGSAVWFEHLNRVANRDIFWWTESPISYARLLRTGLIPILLLSGVLLEYSIVQIGDEEFEYDWGGGYELERLFFDLRGVQGQGRGRENPVRRHHITPDEGKNDYTHTAFTQRLVAYLLWVDPSLRKRIIDSNRYLENTPEADANLTKDDKVLLIQYFLRPPSDSRLLGSEWNALRNAVVRMVLAEISYYLNTTRDVERARKILGALPYKPSYMPPDSARQASQRCLIPAMGLRYNPKMHEQPTQNAGVQSILERQIEKHSLPRAAVEFGILDPEALKQIHDIGCQMAMLAFGAHPLFGLWHSWLQNKDLDPSTPLPPLLTDVINNNPEYDPEKKLGYAAILTEPTLSKIYPIYLQNPCFFGPDARKPDTPEQFASDVSFYGRALLEKVLNQILTAEGIEDNNLMKLDQSRQYFRLAETVGPHNSREHGPFYLRRALELEEEYSKVRTQANLELHRFAQAMWQLMDSIKHPEKRYVLRGRPGDNVEEMYVKVISIDVDRHGPVFTLFIASDLEMLDYALLPDKVIKENADKIRARKGGSGLLYNTMNIPAYFFTRDDYNIAEKGI